MSPKSLTATEYLVDMNRDYGQVLFERTGATKTNYTFGTDLIGLDTDVEQYSFHKDAIESHRLIADQTGAVAENAYYDSCIYRWRTFPVRWVSDPKVNACQRNDAARLVYQFFI